MVLNTSKNRSEKATRNVPSINIRGAFHACVTDLGEGFLVRLALESLAQKLENVIVHRLDAEGHVAETDARIFSTRARA